MAILKNYIKIQVFLLIALYTYPCYAQESRYSFVFSSAPIAEVIDEITKQSKINILYNPRIFKEYTLVSGQFNNLTVTEALDTILHQTAIGYKFFKKNIVLIRKNDQVFTNHKISNRVEENGNVQHKRLVDTITYSIITYDTVVTNLTRYVPVYDSIRIFDTINVIRKTDAYKLVYQPEKKTFITGISLTQGKLFSDAVVNNFEDDARRKIKESISEKSSNGIVLSCIYRMSSWQIETGLTLVSNKYSFLYSNILKGFSTRIDTIDRYYSNIVDNDTTWVYVTEEKQIETISEKRINSKASLYYFSIPIILGYSKTKRNFTYEIKGGVLINYYAGSKGYYLTSTAENEISATKTKLSTPKLTMDLFGAFALDYFLDNHLHLLIQPYLSYGAVGYKQDTDYVFQNLQVGYQLGLRYYF